MKRKKLCVALVAAMTTMCLAGCSGSIVEKANESAKQDEVVNESTEALPPSESEVEVQESLDLTDLTENVPLKFNLAYGNKSRTMTYGQESPLTMPDGTVVTSGMLKPMWSYVETQMNSKFTDVTVQDQKATEMIQTQLTTNFSGANIFGGNSIANDLMYYGTEGKFVDLTEMMEQGYMPNFKAYLDKNPDVRSAITAYDGNIYHVPYIAEIGSFARTFNIRESWVTTLLDEANIYDANSLDLYYEGFYVGDNKRTGKNGGTVTPKEGISITKKTDESIIEIQNNLGEKNGETLTMALIEYINNNYDYENPSELYLGEKAAYDIDELVALMRCIKANPTLLTGGKADVVWPMFVRQSSYREDLMRLGTYFGGVRAHGSDSYEARWVIDEAGDIQYTYATEGMYNLLHYLSQMEAEGLIYSDTYNTTNKTNFRSTLWGTDDGEAPSYGFMTFDWIASSTSDSLNKDTVSILPPVACVNGVWQYYIDNTRVIKPDGWAISVAGSTEDEVHRACAVMDYFFTEEGHQVQNYGVPMMVEENEFFVGPDGIEYPKFNSWVVESAGEFAKGDLSTFLRDWIGSIMPIGYEKSIGFEYQYTSERGYDAWTLLQNSTTNMPSYSGEGLEGENPNYYKLIPPVFSLTAKQSETIAENTFFDDSITEMMFNIVRYGTKGGAPTGAVVPESYDEYLAEFNAKGLPVYVETYQNAYRVMLINNQ